MAITHEDTNDGEEPFQLVSCGAGQRVGKGEDLIISPDANVSCVTFGAGGFVGIGRHDAAIPGPQIHDQAGKLVMIGANKDTLEGMPQSAHATDTAKRDAFVDIETAAHSG